MRRFPGNEDARRRLSRIALVAAISLLGTSGMLAAAAAGQQQVVAPSFDQQHAADYVGSETCGTCHADIGKSFPANPHAKLALEHQGHGATCESCHGPGKAHVESGGDVTKIIRLKNASAEKIDSTCLNCHATTHPNFPHLVARTRWH